MPRLMMPPDDGVVIDIEALVDWCEEEAFDPRDEEGLAQAAPMLAGLARNRDFLADMAIAELKNRCVGQRRHNPYSAQVMLLRPPSGKYLLRAAFWPAERDHVVRMSGTAPFLYHVPHDHGFDFLTVGYLGPGYASDYYDYDGAAVAGAPGEKVALRFVERSCLSQGRMLLYRANHDVHAQLPAQAMSVSLNILAATPDQDWRRQYRFDVGAGTIAQCMTISSAQMLLELAVGCGSGNALDIAAAFARDHPEDPKRWTAWAAMGDAMADGAALLAHAERGSGSSSPLIRRASEKLLKNIRNGRGGSCPVRSDPVG